MPEQNIVDKIGNDEFYKDYSELNSALLTSGRANVTARQRIIQKSKNALQPLLVYH